MSESTSAPGAAGAAVAGDDSEGKEQQQQGLVKGTAEGEVGEQQGAGGEGGEEASVPPPEPSTSAPQPHAHAPACFVITHSVAKRHNVGTIARCATAFGVKQLCLVGSRQFNTFGSHGSDAHVDFGHYNTLDQCVLHLREVEGCSIVGVEIVEGAQPVHKHPFKGPTAFMLGNEGQGLSPKQMALCDSFVYIPQHGAGTASLNVAVACSIVLHHFAIWAEYSERGREGFKFVVAPRQQRTRARGVAGDPEDIRRERQARRQQQQQDGPGGSADGGGGSGEEEEGQGEAEQGEQGEGEEAAGQARAGGRGDTAKRPFGDMELF